MGLIKNMEEVGTTDLRKSALEIIENGISAVLPEAVMDDISFDPETKTLIIKGSSYTLSGRLFIIGGGKAAGRMAEAAESIFGPDMITAGVVTCKDAEYDTQKIKVIEAGHPIPDEAGVRGVQEMLDLKVKHSIGMDDVVLFLISGGGSALMPCPVDGVTLDDLQETTNQLVSSGAQINQINIVRKHLSRIKGGQLGAYFYPAQVISLILSDVIGNDLETIASGPTVPDSSTFEQAMDVVRSNSINPPEPVRTYLENGLEGKSKETPKSLENCENIIIGDNKKALDAMAEKASELGFSPKIITSEQVGDPESAAKKRAKEIKDGKYDDYDAIILGGETTPKLPDNPGKGGRNQHYTAVSMVELEGLEGEWVAASVGTDGSDFLKDVAGAIVDQDSLGKAGDDVTDHLTRFDSYTLLDRIGSIIRTGATGTNVCDIVLYLRKRR